MNNLPPQKTRRIVFMISGATDALIGAVLLLIGLGVLPIDPASYGAGRWAVNLLGGVMFLLGAVVFAYNLSRLEE